MGSIEAISDLIIEAREEIDNDRCLPTKVLNALHNAKIFRMSLPKKLGGGEFTPELLSRAAERLAKADASVGSSIVFVFMSSESFISLKEV